MQLTGVVIPTASAAGDFKVTGTSCLSVLPAGGSCGVDVAFTPANTGLQFDSLTVTDAAGDVRSIILAGTGDNYTMALASAQPIEVSVAPGGTVAVAAVLTPDSVFGQDGEKVTFSCPPTADLPINTSCAVTPCPASITPGTPANITVTIVTSSKTVQAPLPSGGCSSYGPPPESALVGPMAEREIRGPDAWPLSSALLLGLLAAAALGVRVAAWRRRKSSVIFAAAAMLALVLAGCHHGGAGVTSATPLGVSSINIQGIATDASGNTLNTSRIIQGTQGTGFLLDVIANAGTGGGTGPFDVRRAPVAIVSTFSVLSCPPVFWRVFRFSALNLGGAGRSRGTSLWISFSMMRSHEERPLSATAGRRSAQKAAPLLGMTNVTTKDALPPAYR